jgi:dTDP-glucose 4,6-dehydratase
MKVLVTGGAGFLGSAFVRRAVRQGMEVVVADKLAHAGDLERMGGAAPPAVFHKVDLAGSEAAEALVRKERPGMVVHFAAETHVDRSILEPLAFVDANVTATANLLAAAERCGVGKFIHLSTDEVYGDLGSADAAAFRETDRLRPSSPYAASKAAADMMVLAFHRTYGLPVVIARPTNNYGPWQHPDKLIPLTVTRALLGRPVPVYGGGANLRSWLFADDCIEGIFRLLEHGRPGEIYNLGGSEEVSALDVVCRVLGLMKADEGLIEHTADRPGHDVRYSVDSSKIESEASWKAGTTFEHGLEQTVAWCLEHREWLLKSKKSIDEFVRRVRTRFESMKP